MLSFGALQPRNSKTLSWVCLLAETLRNQFRDVIVSCYLPGHSYEQTSKMSNCHEVSLNGDPWSSNSRTGNLLSCRRLFLDSHLQRANAFRLEFSLEPFRKAVNSMCFDNSRFTCEINDVNDPKVCSRVRLWVCSLGGYRFSSVKPSGSGGLRSHSSFSKYLHLKCSGKNPNALATLAHWKAKGNSWI